MQVSGFWIYFLEPGYFFSKILSEFRKKIVALQEENLRLAAYLQNAVNTVHPSLMRPINLVNERYNQQLTTGSLILEVGSSGNTLQEALTAVRLFAEGVGPALAKQIQ